MLIQRNNLCETLFINNVKKQSPITTSSRDIRKRRRLHFKSHESFYWFHFFSPKEIEMGIS